MHVLNFLKKLYLVEYSRKKKNCSERVLICCYRTFPRQRQVGVCAVHMLSKNFVLTWHVGTKRNEEFGQPGFKFLFDCNWSGLIATIYSMMNLGKWSNTTLGILSRHPRTFWHPKRWSLMGITYWWVLLWKVFEYLDGEIEQRVVTPYRRI